MNHLRMEKIIRESGLMVASLDDQTTDQIDEVVNRLENLAPLTAGDKSLVDGHWIMERTGLGKGIALGRLKMWLHRLQIERDLVDVEAVETVLCGLNWDHENYHEWPQIEF